VLSGDRQNQEESRPVETALYFDPSLPDNITASPQLDFCSSGRFLDSQFQ
jgi:hypothetical protein